MTSTDDILPLSFGITGFKVEDLVSKEFTSEVKNAFPTSVIFQVAIGFTDSKDVVIVSHDRTIEGKEVTWRIDRVDVEGSDPKRNKTVVNALQKVIHK